MRRDDGRRLDRRDAARRECRPAGREKAGGIDAEVRIALGEAANPLPRTFLRGKFLNLAGWRLGANHALALLRTLDDMRTLSSVGLLIAGSVPADLRLFDIPEGSCGGHCGRACTPPFDQGMRDDPEKQIAPAIWSLVATEVSNVIDNVDNEDASDYAEQYWREFPPGSPVFVSKKMTILSRSEREKVAYREVLGEP